VRVGVRRRVQPGRAGCRPRDEPLLLPGRRTTQREVRMTDMRKRRKALCRIIIKPKPYWPELYFYILFTFIALS